MFENTNHADGTLNLRHQDHIVYLSEYERVTLENENTEFDVIAVCGECAAHILNGEEDHDFTPAELSQWVRDHNWMWYAGVQFYPSIYWTCEACRMDMLEDAFILNDVQD